jgi:hypothetical protein
VTVMDEIAELVERLREVDPQFWLSVPATEQQIAELASAFGRPMPPSYRTFLARYGALCFPNDYYSGIIDGNIDASRGCAWTDTKYAREFCQLPPHYLVVQPDDDGYVCLDFSRTTTNDEHPVVYHMPFRNTPFNELAPNYAAWLRECLLGWLEVD